MQALWWWAGVGGRKKSKSVTLDCRSCCMTWDNWLHSASLLAMTLASFVCKEVISPRTCASMTSGKECLAFQHSGNVQSGCMACRRLYLRDNDQNAGSEDAVKLSCECHFAQIMEVAKVSTWKHTSVPGLDQMNLGCQSLRPHCVMLHDCDQTISISLLRVALQPLWTLSASVLLSSGRVSVLLGTSARSLHRPGAPSSAPQSYPSVPM